MQQLGSGFIVAIVVFLILMYMSIRRVMEWERGVVLRLGKFQSVRGPGLRWIWPIIDQLIKVETRTITMDVPKQDMMTRDNVPVQVDAVVFFQVLNAKDAIVKVENFVKATSLKSQTMLRSIIGQSELDELLAQREKINRELQTVIDEQTEPWGIKVSAVDVRDVVLPEGMKRSMATQAEVERERRAKIINAEGEFQAAQRLADAAEIIGKNPIALQLRYLQTLREVASEHNSTTIFPVPIDLLTPFMKMAAKMTEEKPE